MQSYIVSSKNTFLHFSESEQPTFRKALSSPDVKFSVTKPRKMSICSVSTACDMGSFASISPRSSVSSGMDSVESEHTVMIRHIPCKYPQEALMQEVLEFTSNFDYFYLPPARTAKIEKNLGYAFVNFKSSYEAQQFMEAFEGYAFKMFPNSLKRAQVTYAELQGVEANMESYWNSKVDKTKYAPWVSQN